MSLPGFLFLLAHFLPFLSHHFQIILTSGPEGEKSEGKFKDIEILEIIAISSSNPDNSLIFRIVNYIPYFNLFRVVKLVAYAYSADPIQMPQNMSD